MIQVDYFKVSDLLEMRAEAIDGDVANGIDTDLWAHANANLGPAYTGRIDGRIIGVGGVRITHRNVGHVWAAFHRDIAVHKFECFRFLLGALETLEEAFEFRHLRTLSRKDFPESQRLLEHLGFRRVRYIKEKGHFLYVRKP